MDAPVGSIDLDKLKEPMFVIVSQLVDQRRGAQNVRSLFDKTVFEAVSDPQDLQTVTAEQQKVLTDFRQKFLTARTQQIAFKNMFVESLRVWDESQPLYVEDKVTPAAADKPAGVAIKTFYEETNVASSAVNRSTEEKVEAIGQERFFYDPYAIPPEKAERKFRMLNRNSLPRSPRVAEFPRYPSPGSDDDSYMYFREKNSKEKEQLKVIRSGAPVHPYETKLKLAHGQNIPELITEIKPKQPLTDAELARQMQEQLNLEEALKVQDEWDREERAKLRLAKAPPALTPANYAYPTYSPDASQPIRDPFAYPNPSQLEPSFYETRYPPNPESIDQSIRRPELKEQAPKKLDSPETIAGSKKYGTVTILAHSQERKVYKNDVNPDGLSNAIIGSELGRNVVTCYEICNFELNKFYDSEIVILDGFNFVLSSLNNCNIFLHHCGIDDKLPSFSVKTAINTNFRVYQCKSVIFENLTDCTIEIRDTKNITMTNCVNCKLILMEDGFFKECAITVSHVVWDHFK